MRWDEIGYVFPSRKKRRHTVYNAFFIIMDYYVMRLTYEFLGSLLEFQLYSEELYRQVCFSNLCYAFFSFLLYLSCLILKRCYLNCVNRRSPMFQKGYLVSATMEM